MKLAARLAALEAFVERSNNGLVIAWMIDGASDDDVIAVNVVSAHNAILQRKPGETLAELVNRGKALNPYLEHHSFMFQYSEESKVRLGKSELVHAVPNVWPDPSPVGHARHVEYK